MLHPSLFADADPNDTLSIDGVARNLEDLPIPERVRVLSMQQPWASLLVIQAKRIETRRWSTPYRGWVLLHSGARPWRAKHICDLITQRLGAPVFSTHDAIYPRGAYIGIARLVDVYPYDAIRWQREMHEHCCDWAFQPPTYGWEFSHTYRFAEPIPAKGQLGLYSVARSAFEQARIWIP